MLHFTPPSNIYYLYYVARYVDDIFFQSAFLMPSIKMTMIIEYEESESVERI